jgi:hypothetical protein
MDLLSDVITYVRRLVKTPSNAVLTDSLIVDYINRFWIMDVDARIQLFDLKTKYQFQTAPGVDQYNMPLYDIQPNPLANNTLQAPIASLPVYQGFVGPCFINGIAVPFYTERRVFNNIYPNYVQQQLQVGTGNGTAGPYNLQIPFLSSVPPTPPTAINSTIIRGHVDLIGIISMINNGGSNIDPPVVASGATFITKIPTTSVYSSVYITSTDGTGANVIVQDSGEFLQGNVNYGLLMKPGNAPFGNTELSLASFPNNYTTTLNTVNYQTGVINVEFPVAIPAGNPINVQCIFYQLGIPRGILYFNNTLTLRAPPNTQYLVELDAYLTPAAFLTTTAALPFAYMAEYIARGAARKILSDTGDWEQFQAYEPLFLEQESLVHIRSQRQFTATRTQTIYSQGSFGQTGSSGASGFGIT